MLYIDNLAEFVKQAIERELEGTFYPQNRELADTVDVRLRYFQSGTISVRCSILTIWLSL